MSATITIQEFKMWLQGVEEMQDEDWSPSKAQWTKIRSKIDEIAHRMAEPELTNHSGQFSNAVVHHPTADATISPDFALNAPDPLAGIPIGMAPEMSGSSINMSAMMQPQPPIRAPFARGAGNIPVRTPDDISGQPYTPPFA